MPPQKQRLNTSKAETASLTITIVSLSFSLLLAAAFPPVTDEAYYIGWARSVSWPSWGFFDHPPFVSWLAAPSRWASGIFAARILVWVAAVLAIYFIFRLTRRIAPDRPLVATAIIASSIGGLAGGFLLTPDAGLLLAWAIALHEAHEALIANPKRWLSAGLATGLGILSKYTMVIIGPVFLFALWRDSRRQLKSPWPYLGGVVCLAVLLPHLWWQSQNNWITLKFQFRHGFSVEQDHYSRSTLPRASDAQLNSSADLAKKRLLSAMQNTPGFSEALVKPKIPKTQFERAWQYVGDYWGGIAGLWGAYAVAWLTWVIRRRPDQGPKSSESYPKGFSLIKYSALFPVLFFGLLSPFTKIEANWPAMHMMGTAVWATWSLRPSTRILAASLVAHILLLSSLGIVLMAPDALPSARENRLLLESRGYQALSDWAYQNYQGEVIAVDSYQLKSAINFRSPHVNVVQWPGFTRDSDYTMGREGDVAQEKKIINQPKVSVISTDGKPKTIPNFEATAFRGIRVCPDGNVGIFSEQQTTLPCIKGLREWWIIEYINQKP